MFVSNNCSIKHCECWRNRSQPEQMECLKTNRMLKMRNHIDLLCAFKLKQLRWWWCDVLISIRFTKRCEIWNCPDGRWYLSTWRILALFHRLLSLICSTGYSTSLNSTSNFAKGTHNTHCSSNLTRYAEWLLE